MGHEGEKTRDNTSQETSKVERERIAVPDTTIEDRTTGLTEIEQDSDTKTSLETSWPGYERWEKRKPTDSAHNL